MSKSGSESPNPEVQKQLRVLLSCPACELQYDAGGREPGTRFHCGCGTLITVPELQTKEDSAVIRCSSCGAPKRGEGDFCNFCGATFTVHERDLNTICPRCMARISRRSRYCHHCGISIIPNALNEQRTTYACPCCPSQNLNSRQLGEGGVTVLECSRCGGLWLGHDAFRLLQNGARKRELAWLSAHTSEAAVSSSHSSRASGPLYRTCCVCSKQMSRRNFSRGTGVILDICPADGIWFDLGELEQILKKIQSGEVTRSKHRAREREREREVLRRVKRVGDPLEKAAAEEFGRQPSPAPDFVSGVIRFLLDG